MDRHHGTVGLRWTQHPLIDAGVAALTVFCGHAGPGEVTFDDLRDFAAFADEAQALKSVASYLSVLFTSNVGFLQPSYTPERKREEARSILWSFERPTDAGLPQCVYCRNPAIRIVHRDLAPMLTGRGVVNFFPSGQHGEAICGLCMAAMQALVLGAPFVSGRALVTVADDAELMLDLTREWVDESQRRINLQLGAGAGALALKAPKTRIIDRLVKLLAKPEHDYHQGGITAFHLTNSGQGPDIDIYTLPSSVVRFVQRARLPAYRSAWNVAAARSWRRANKELDASGLPDEGRGDLNNSLYDDLFRLPVEAGRFLRRHLRGLAIARMEARKGDGDRAPEELPLWKLTTLFLTEVVGMDKVRIDSIRVLADALVEDIAGTNDRRLFDRAFRAQRFGDVRGLLLSDGFQRLRREQTPLISLDAFLTVFEEGEEVSRSDWRLAWDLVLIRLLEQLHATSFFVKNKDVIETTAAAVDSQLAAQEE